MKRPAPDAMRVACNCNEVRSHDTCPLERAIGRGGAMLMPFMAFETADSEDASKSSIPKMLQADNCEQLTLATVYAFDL